MQSKRQSLVTNYWSFTIFTTSWGYVFFISFSLSLSLSLSLFLSFLTKKIQPCFVHTGNYFCHYFYYEFSWSAAYLQEEEFIHLARPHFIDGFWPTCLSVYRLSWISIVYLSRRLQANRQIAWALHTVRTLVWKALFRETPAAQAHQLDWTRDLRSIYYVLI